MLINKTEVGSHPPRYRDIFQSLICQSVAINTRTLDQWNKRQESRNRPKHMDIWYVIEVATFTSGEKMAYFNGVGESGFVVPTPDRRRQGQTSGGLRNCKILEDKSL